MEAPLVSVVMATFNESAEYITTSIEKYFKSELSELGVNYCR